MSGVKILGIDYGKKRIGLAISVPGTSFAVGYKILEVDPAEPPVSVIENIREIVGKEHISALVIGLPKQFDNTLGIAGKEVMRFADEVKKNIAVPVVMWDERLTSKQAEVLLRDVNMSHKDKREQVNVTAAQVMLQSYLDAQASRVPADAPEGTAPKAFGEPEPNEKEHESPH
ncbi:MAG: Holliday junction resolvase RuvX [Planctomycetes bacterium]|nr:Holliday junction resolvase RuvX [Planctomycetota bacterium]